MISESSCAIGAIEAPCAILAVGVCDRVTPSAGFRMVKVSSLQPGHLASSRLAFPALRPGKI